jgi:hypothetical protein
MHRFDPAFDLVRLQIELIADGDTNVIRNIRNRNLRGGANRFLPAACIQNSIFLNPTIDKRPPVPGTALDGGYRFLTYFSGAFGFGQGLSFWRQEDLDEAARYVALYKQYRHCLEGDFYRLLPPPRDLNAWDGWQYDDPKEDSGVLLFFRLHANWDWQKEIRPARLDCPADYDFETVSGDMIIEPSADAIKVTCAEFPGAALIRYHRRGKVAGVHSTQQVCGAEQDAGAGALPEALSG